MAVLVTAVHARISIIQDTKMTSQDTKLTNQDTKMTSQDNESSILDGVLTPCFTALDDSIGISNGLIVELDDSVVFLAACFVDL